jgi:transposase
MAHKTIIGVDLAKHMFQVCMVNHKGTLKANTTVTRGKLLAFMARQPPALVVMEACSGAHDWARRFRAVGHEVRWLAPQYVVPFRHGQKNDPNDALALTEAGRRPSIPSVPVKSAEQQDIQAWHRVRERLVKNRTALANHIRGLLLEYGVIVPQGLSRLRHRLPGILDDADHGLSCAFRELLQSLAHELSALDASVAEVTPRLTRISHDLDACQRLREMDGIGPLNATALVAALGNGHAFRHGRQVAAWLGLVPRQYSSGGKTRFAGISKRGNSYLRCLLIHGARSVVSRARTKTDATSVWIRQLVGRVGVNKACVAMANKMARVAWALLRTGEHYRKPEKLQSQVA